MKKDKYLQIFNYLLEFSRLRTVPVRNIESSNQYSEILWFNDIPNNDLFDCVTFPNFNSDSDFWLKIYKPKNEPKEPNFPKIDGEFVEWIKKNTLLSFDSFPILNESITKKGETLFIADYPELVKEFENYCENKWIDDLNYYNEQIKIYNSQLEEYEKLSRTYKQLFTFYNKAQQFGEEFELVVGVGVLFFKDKDGTQVFRHVLTSKAEISFEYSSKESYVVVSPGIENEIQIESDSIIDLVNQFDSIDIVDAEKKVLKFIKENEITDEPFDSRIKDALQIFADRIRDDGKFIDSLLKPKDFTDRPVIQFSPALILRKRNTKSLTSLYEKIIIDISNSNSDIDIKSINDLIGEEDNEDLSIDSDEPEKGDSNDIETIYFPKKYNDEQIEIVEKIRKNSKVLVQGPPGTGKSHTIANLICHLLANGNKILVTAYTKRALQVLKNQLPVDFQNLTVNLLSSDSSSIQDLDKSVNAINDELSSNSDLNILNTKIEELEFELRVVKEGIAKSKNDWISIKEKNTRTQILNDNYKGTLTEIAESLENDIQKFSWFKDKIYDINKIDLIDKIIDFNTQTESYAKIDISEFNYEFPDIERMIMIETFGKYITLFNKYEKEKELRTSTFELYLTEYINPVYDKLLVDLEELQNLYLIISKNDFPYKSDILKNGSIDINIWQKRIEKAVSIILNCNREKLEYYDRNIDIQYPDGKNLKKLNYDANILNDYLKEGNSLSGFLFTIKKAILPQNIKERLYFLDSVFVNGSNCNNLEAFEKVIYDIKINQDFEELSNLFGNTNLKSYSEKLFYYNQLIAAGESLISVFNKSETVKAAIEKPTNIKIISFDVNQFELIKGEIDFNRFTRAYIDFKTHLINFKNKIKIENVHPKLKDLSSAIDDLNFQDFRDLYNQILDLKSRKIEYNKYINVKTSLIIDFPLLVDAIVNQTFDISRLSQLKDAIMFNNALQKINQILDDDYEIRLLKKLLDLEVKEEELISTVASKKAWYSVISSLSSNPQLKRHLQAWVLAVKKIGKTGTGKRALKFRKEAQLQMENCKNSVPCWIMPLYKVAETINPQKEMYDYVIIDEASQLGADAMFLYFISKKIIIVGDDKQTSPEYVGVDSNTMTPHINRFLQDIPFKNYYGIETSFFDHAKVFCNGMTVLREHFRCMPEIIEFCNKHFYLPDGKGLYPLKQYSENRLNPIASIYTDNGFIEGTYSNIVNKVEAEAIANKIAEIITKEEYYTIKDGNKIPKSIGVIALQGNKQADLIDTLILKKIGEKEYKNRKIICGNSASFQGDERDIMFLSLITANNHRRQALTDDNDKRRFNVAVSRAKEQIWLIHSILPDDLSNHDDLRYKILEHFINHKPTLIPQSKPFERTMGSQPKPFDSWFEVDVYNDIVSKGYSVIPQYEVARGKYRIDLVVLLPNGVKIAIECDGDKFHGAEQFENDMMRQKVLERCGWQFFRVRGAEYYSNRIKSIAELWILLEKNDTSKSITILQDEIEEEFINDTNLQRESCFLDNKVEVLHSNVNSSVLIKDSSESELRNILKSSKDIFSFPEILIFTSNHNVYKFKNNGLFSQSDLLTNIEFEKDEKPIYLTGTNSYNGFIIFGYDNGKVSKIPLQAYVTTNNRKKLKNAYSNLNKLIFIEHFENEVDLIATSNINKVIVFNTIQLSLIKSSSSAGVQILHLKDDSKMNKIKRLNTVNLKDPEYYRKGGLNVVGYYLKDGDII